MRHVRNISAEKTMLPAQARSILVKQAQLELAGEALGIVERVSALIKGESGGGGEEE